MDTFGQVPVLLYVINGPTEKIRIRGSVRRLKRDNIWSDALFGRDFI